MKAHGRINTIESTIEDIVRRISRENDARTERLAYRLGAAEERERRHLETIANLHFDRDNRRERKAAAK